jgi:23S rRNA (adenine-N6)-dimethyltransferase
VAGRGAHRARHARRRAPDRHFLRPKLAAAIVADARVRQHELVLDIGAGTGRLTHWLARAGAHVRAIELDPGHAQTLRERFAGSPDVTVVEGDALVVPLPRVPFRVVANLPFGRTTAILRRVLDDPRVPLARADVIVEWGLARKRAGCSPSTLLGVCWSAWFEPMLVRRLPRGGFEPPPSVDAGLLRFVRRTEPLVAISDATAFRRFVRLGFEDRLPAGRAARRVYRELGIARGATARELDVYQWAELFHALRCRDARANVRS